MNQTGSTNVSLTFCAVIGLFLGALVTGLLMVVGDWDFLPAAAVGCLFLILAVLLLPLIFIKRDGSDVPFGAPVTGNEAGTAPTASDSAARTMAEPAPTAAAPTVAATAAPAAAAPAAATPAAAPVKASASLPGEDELANRKGDWKYEGEASAPAKKAAPAAAAAPVAEGDPGEKPATLSAARDGGPDQVTGNLSHLSCLMTLGQVNRKGILVGERSINGIDNLPSDEALNGFPFPNVIWGHEGVVGESFVGQAIAGGHVIQNGSSDLDDQFIFLEFATDGRAYHVDFSEMLAQTTSLNSTEGPENLTWVTPQELTILFDHDNDDSTTPLVRRSLKDVLDDEPDFSTVFSAGKVRADLRLGQGPNGELYILNKRNGWVYVATNTL